MIGDPLYTVPYNTGSPSVRRNFCFEVHGRSNTHFNLISDKCVSVNAHYSGVEGGLNIISGVSIRAEDDNGMCRNIFVSLDGCSASTSTGDGELASIAGFFQSGGISVRPGNDRVRVSVPNCEYLNLILWVICERGDIDMIRFQIARGLNLRPTSHGLLGEDRSSMADTTVVPKY